MKLYIIHGWTYTVDPWEETISILKSKGVDIIMLHVPGLTAPSKKVWTISEYAAWADKNIPDGAIALGHSNGGRILLNLLSQNPNKLSHLILLDSAGVYEKSTRRDLLRKASKAAAPLKKVPGLRKVVHKLTRATDYAKAPENMKQTLANMLDSDKDLPLAEVTTPTTIIWGAEDRVTPLRQAKVLRNTLKNSTIKIHKKWSHAPYIDDPKGLAKVLLDTLAEIAPTSVKSPNSTLKAHQSTNRFIPNPHRSTSRANQSSQAAHESKEQFQ